MRILDTGMLAVQAVTNRSDKLSSLFLTTLQCRLSHAACAQHHPCATESYFSESKLALCLSPSPGGKRFLLRLARLQSRAHVWNSAEGPMAAPGAQPVLRGELGWDRSARGEPGTEPGSEPGSEPVLGPASTATGCGCPPALQPRRGTDCKILF